MDKESSKKRDAFIKYMEKDKQIRDLLSSHYEHVALRGAVLIDGHHVFLNIISSIKRLRDNPERFLRTFHPNSKDLTKFVDLVSEAKIFEHNPWRVARIYGECVYRICDYANQKFKADVLGDDREFLPHHKLGVPFELRDEQAVNLDVNEFVTNFLSEFSPKKFLVAELNAQRWVFDATMPEANQVRERLSQNHQYWRNRDKSKSDNLRAWIEALDKGNWGFFENQIRGSIVVPYDLKNSVLKALEDKDWMYGEFNLKTQPRVISGFNGYVENREKGVDTKLVIKGCELAADKDVDWVWVVTADGDHAPLIDHLKEKGKEVFLTSLSHPSKALLTALGDGTHYLHFDELFDLTDMLSHLEQAQQAGTLTDKNAGAGMDWQVYFSAHTDFFTRQLEEAGLLHPDTDLERF